MKTTFYHGFQSFFCTALSVRNWSLLLTAGHAVLLATWLLLASWHFGTDMCVPAPVVLAACRGVEPGTQGLTLPLQVLGLCSDFLELIMLIGSLVGLQTGSDRLSNRVWEDPLFCVSHEVCLPVHNLFGSFVYFVKAKMRQSLASLDGVILKNFVDEVFSNFLPCVNMFKSVLEGSVPGNDTSEVGWTIVSRPDSWPQPHQVVKCLF